MPSYKYRGLLVKKVRAWGFPTILERPTAEGCYAEPYILCQDRGSLYCSIENSGRVAIYRSGEDDLVAWEVREFAKVKAADFAKAVQEAKTLLAFTN